MLTNVVSSRLVPQRTHTYFALNDSSSHILSWTEAVYSHRTAFIILKALSLNNYRRCVANGKLLESDEYSFMLGEFIREFLLSGLLDIHRVLLFILH